MLGVLVFAVSVVGFAGTAAADSMTTLASFTDPRGAMPIRAGHTIKRARYGPFNIPGNGQIHNALKFDAAAPCTNCYITDMVPSLVYSSPPSNCMKIVQWTTTCHQITSGPLSNVEWRRCRGLSVNWG